MISVTITDASGRTLSGQTTLPPLRVLPHRSRSPDVSSEGANKVLPGQLEHLGVELGGEQLPVEFLEVVLVALEMGLAEIEPRPPILAAHHA